MCNDAWLCSWIWTESICCILSTILHITIRVFRWRRSFCELVAHWFNLYVVHASTVSFHSLYNSFVVSYTTTLLTFVATSIGTTRWSKTTSSKMGETKQVDLDTLLTVAGFNWNKGHEVLQLWNPFPISYSFVVQGSECNRRWTQTKSVIVCSLNLWLVMDVPN